MKRSLELTEVEMAEDRLTYQVAVKKGEFLVLFNSNPSNVSFQLNL